MLLAAQRYGLVDAPPRLLTEDEWKTVKEKAKLRRDFQQPCVICKEELGLQQHVGLEHLLRGRDIFLTTCVRVPLSLRLALRLDTGT